MSARAAAAPGVEAGASILSPAGLDALLATLAADGFRVIGPTLGEGAVVYDDVASTADLPRGWGDDQAPGRYRLAPRGDGALFGYAVGPQSWKRFLHPPRERLWTATLGQEDGRETAEVRPEPLPDARFAFIGVRACELAAIAVQDRVLTGGEFVDPRYAARREGAFLVAVTCADPAATCFCTSMGGGPEPRGGHDLALTELDPAGDHRFLVRAASEAGRAMLARLPARPARADEIAAAEQVGVQAAARMGRAMPPGDPRLLLGDPEHPRWEAVAERCLSCGACTMVCPTCFCTTTEEVGDLAGRETGRDQRWDSCFATEFSFLHGGAVRTSGRARYRQWLTHKLATWIDQFGISGCVGCGRCIAWCPAGIDLTEEMAAFAATREGAACAETREDAG
ncbi:4Fe-4S dicluster domain-containing protein [Albimonas sp. CAU 1670]|uniref:4Fe-4S dicluster domain-containing protein n=1 Tax=Albimonas sp. CAU 1670 TaxID=3032599 RepID=UPI0023DA3791|nr:4Fe-4S dicluster domain-containing protein [Albimonas sp. CAU 1670]MDF2231825.1 4Fe-4S dicluster domain-containing protein [Albimonas sp. CAU 1670]